MSLLLWNRSRKLVWLGIEYSVANQWVDTTNYKTYILKKYPRRFLRLPPDHNVGLISQHLLRCQSYFGNSEVLRKANILSLLCGSLWLSSPLLISMCTCHRLWLGHGILCRGVTSLLWNDIELSWKLHLPEHLLRISTGKNGNVVTF